MAGHFASGKVTLSDTSLKNLLANIEKCSILYCNVKAIGGFIVALQIGVEKIWSQGLELIKKRVYLKKKHGHYIVNYYNRTYDLLKSYKFKFMAKVIDVKNGRVAIGATFYFDPSAWRTNYYGSNIYARRYWRASKEVARETASGYHAKWYGSDSQRKIGGSWGITGGNMTRRVKVGTRSQGKHIRGEWVGGGKMFRPHSYTWGEGKDSNVGIKLIDFLDQGYHIGKGGPERKGRDFLGRLHQIEQQTYPVVRYHNGEEIVELTNLPNVGDRIGKWNHKAEVAFNKLDARSLESTAYALENYIKEWSKASSDIAKSYLTSALLKRKSIN